MLETSKLFSTSLFLSWYKTGNYLISEIKMYFVGNHFQYFNNQNININLAYRPITVLISYFQKLERNNIIGRLKYHIYLNPLLKNVTQ